MGDTLEDEESFSKELLKVNDLWGSDAYLDGLFSNPKIQEILDHFFPHTYFAREIICSVFGVTIDELEKTHKDQDETKSPKYALYEILEILIAQAYQKGFYDCADLLGEESPLEGKENQKD